MISAILDSRANRYKTADDDTYRFVDTGLAGPVQLMSDAQITPTLEGIGAVLQASTLVTPPGGIQICAGSWPFAHAAACANG